MAVTAPPVLSPRMSFEIRRKGIHVGGALAAVGAFIVIPFPVALALAVAAVAVITITWAIRRRRIRVAPEIAELAKPLGDVIEVTRRPGEDYPWAPVSFTIALAIVGSTTELLALDKAFAVAAFGILGVGDAASALIGIAYGKRKLPWSPRKSWEGTAAGFVAGTLAAVVLASVAASAQGEILPLRWFVVCVVGAAAGALAETVPRTQDNLVVPLAALAAMLVTAAGVGVLR